MFSVKLNKIKVRLSLKHLSVGSKMCFLFEYHDFSDRILQVFVLDLSMNTLTSFWFLHIWSVELIHFWTSFLASIMWSCWSSEFGPHTKFRGRLASGMSAAKERHWWNAAYSSKCHNTFSSWTTWTFIYRCWTRLFYGRIFSEDPERYASMDCLGFGNSQTHLYTFVRHHWKQMEDKYQAHRAC